MALHLKVIVIFNIRYGVDIASLFTAPLVGEFHDAVGEQVNGIDGLIIISNIIFYLNENCKDILHI